ncbi:FkbM family methyltransferase [Thiothrix sp.]|jgi:FkbM family methyltransferase|uniref:FkbM family methyltransferase n=1 Tax=Thiothrix sp. TaxID=1032 RepID=UPI00257C91D9|nr:FkbM family methyltransferase [Thiothrix sp.]
MKKQGRTARRIKKILWRFGMPDFSDNYGVMLPVKHALISKGIAKQIYFEEYESKEIDIISKRLDKNDRVMEVGAGIGFLSAFCAKQIGSENVFAYEANPELIDVIKMTHKKNYVSPQIYNIFLADADGECEFYLNDDFWASSSVVNTVSTRKVMIRKVSLNDEIRRIAPTFLIVDIEGGEKDFFALVDLSGVKKICIETHPGILTDKDISEIFNGLMNKGFWLDFSIIRKNVFYFYRDC